MKFRAALRAPRGGPLRQHKLPEGGPVPAPRSEPDAIRDGVSRRASDKGDGPSPPQPKGQVHPRVVRRPSTAPAGVDLRGRKVILKRALIPVLPQTHGNGPSSTPGGSPRQRSPRPRDCSSRRRGERDRSPKRTSSEGADGGERHEWFAARTFEY